MSRRLIAATAVTLLTIWLSIFVIVGAATADASWDQPNQIGASGELLGPISCAQPDFCMVFVESTPKYYVLDGTTWSSEQQLPAADQLGDNDWVDCFDSSHSCTVFTLQGQTFTWTPSAGFGPVSTYFDVNKAGGYVDDVSCVSATFCVAEDSGLVATFNGTTWSAAVTNDPAEVAATQAVNAPGGSASDFIQSTVSCVSSSFCVSVDGLGNFTTFNGTTWSPPAKVASGKIALASVSCATATFCMAGGPQNADYRYDGHTWSPAPTFTGQFFELTQLHCLAVGLCIGGTQDEWEELDGTTWGNADPPVAIFSMSCPSAALCVAGSESGQVTTFHPGPNAARSPATPSAPPAKAATPTRTIAVASTLPSPLHAFAGPARTVANAGITLVAMLALTFPAQLFNHTFEENYDEIVAITQRRLSWLARARARLSASGSSRRDLATFGIVVFVGSILGALRDPQFGANGHSLRTFIATLLALLASTAIGFAVARTFRARRNLDTAARLHALPAGLVVAALCVAVSRISGFQPGYLYGVISGVVFGTALRKREQGQLITLSMAATFVVAIAAWLVWVPVNHAAVHPHASVFVVLADEFLASVFVGSITGAVISMLPLRFMPGHTLFSWHRGWWAATFGLAGFLVVEVLLRPTSGTGHPGQVAWVTAAVLFVIFGVGSVLFREYFDRHVPEDKGRVGLGAGVVAALWQADGLSEQALATQLGVGLDHVTSTVARLERAHWLRRERAPEREEHEAPLRLNPAATAVRDGNAAIGWLTLRRLRWGLTPADRVVLRPQLTAAAAYRRPQLPPQPTPATQPTAAEPAAAPKAPSS